MKYKNNNGFSKIRPWLRAAWGVAGMEVLALEVVVMLIVILRLLVSHPNKQALMFGYTITLSVGAVVVTVATLFCFAALIVWPCYISLRRQGVTSPSNESTIAKVASVLAAVVISLARRAVEVVCAEAVDETVHTIPTIYRDRATMRERRSHRRAVHILTSRSAAKGDGHAAAALTYSFAAVTA